jgi:type II secretory pathway component PulM
MLDERRTQHATLGCGTFILIALIVMFFRRPGISDLQPDMRTLRSEVMELKKAVESQTNEIKRLNEKIGAAQPAEKIPVRP